MAKSLGGMNKNSIKVAAERAGVSVASISRALNGKPGISEKTRKRIIEVCEELGYRPSNAARKLKVGVTEHVGFCLGEFDKPHTHYISCLYETLHDLLSAKDLILTLYNYHDIDTCIKESGSVILTGLDDHDVRIDKLDKAKKPFVTIGKSAGHFWVSPDDFAGGELAAKHLLTLGCEKPLLIESFSEGKGTKSRARGFQSYLQHQGVISGHLYIEELNAIELQTYRVIAKMLEKGALSFDSIFCENDDIAYGVLIACQDYNVSIPEDIKLIGFDDLPNFYDDITSVKQDLGEIASATMLLLDEAIAGLSPRSITLDVRLVLKKTA